MDRIYLFLIRNDVWIYIVSAAGLLWYLVELFRSQRQLRQAMFNIERETATRLRNNALSFVLFSWPSHRHRVLMPALPHPSPELLVPPSPTPNIFATPLSSPTPIGGSEESGGADNSPALAPTATLPPELGGAPARKRICQPHRNQKKRRRLRNFFLPGAHRN
ncbi:MAG: hypothetical protein R3C44_05305 [Chloroflexota bacterium]